MAVLLDPEEMTEEEMIGSPVVWCRPNHFGHQGSHWSYSSYFVHALHLGDHKVRTGEELYKQHKPGEVNSLDFCVASSPQTNFNGDRERKHPAQQPVKLYEKLVLKSSAPGDFVVDPFLGSGTTGVVCKKWKRNFAGADISEKYCRIAEDRIEKTQPEKRQTQLEVAE